MPRQRPHWPSRGRYSRLTPAQTPADSNSDSDSDSGETLELSSQPPARGGRARAPLPNQNSFRRRVLETGADSIANPNAAIAQADAGMGVSSGTLRREFEKRLPPAPAPLPAAPAARPKLIGALKEDKPSLFIAYLNTQPSKKDIASPEVTTADDFNRAEAQLLLNYFNDPSYKLLINELESNRHKFNEPKAPRATITFIITNSALLLALIIGKIISFISRNQISGAILEGTKTTLSTLINDSIGAGIQLIVFPYAVYKTLTNKRNSNTKKALRITNDALISSLKLTGFILLIFAFPHIAAGLFITAYCIDVFREIFKLGITVSKLSKLNSESGNESDQARRQFYFQYKRSSLICKTTSAALIAGLVAVGLLTGPIGTLVAIVSMIAIAIGTRLICNHLKNKVRKEYKENLQKQQADAAIKEPAQPQDAEELRRLARTATLQHIGKADAATLKASPKRPIYHTMFRRTQLPHTGSVTAMPAAAAVAEQRGRGAAVEAMATRHKHKTSEELATLTTFWKTQQTTKPNKVRILEDISNVLVTATAALR